MKLMVTKSNDVFIMGIDIGTTECKASLFNSSGILVRQTGCEYASGRTVHEIDAESVWKTTKEVIRRCNGDFRPNVEGICITSFGETVVLLDQDYRAIGSSILYADGGCEDEWEELNTRIERQKIYQITGIVSHPMYTISRLMWYRKNHPDIWRKTRCCLFFSAYIAMRLGAGCVAENTQAARSMAYSIDGKCWSREILDAAEISPEKLPEIVDTGEVIGEVDISLAHELGFGSVPKIIAGGQDQPCVALGMGAVRGGDAVYGLGTVECMSVVLDRKLLSEEMEKNNFVCTPHVIPGRYMTYGVLYSGGNVITEIRNRLFLQDRRKGENIDYSSVYRNMFEGLDEIQTDLLVAPHFFGMGTPDMNLQAGAEISGLRATTTSKEFLCAVLEGLSFDMRINLEKMESAGVKVGKIRAAGGGVKTAEAVRIRCNALNKELYLPEDVQAGARGAFLIAAKALGWISEWPSGSQKEKKVSPDSQKIIMYEKKFSAYCKYLESRRQIHKSGEHLWSTH